MLIVDRYGSYISFKFINFGIKNYTVALYFSSILHTFFNHLMLEFLNPIQKYTSS